MEKKTLLRSTRSNNYSITDIASTELGASFVMAALLAPLAILIILGSIEFGYHAFSKSRMDFVLRESVNLAAKNQRFLADETVTERDAGSVDGLPASCAAGGLDLTPKCEFLQDLKNRIENELNSFSLDESEGHGLFLGIRSVGERLSVTLDTDLTYHPIVGVPIFNSGLSQPFNITVLAEEASAAPEPELFDCFGRRAGTVSLALLQDESERIGCPCPANPGDVTKGVEGGVCTCREGFIVNPHDPTGPCICAATGATPQYNEPGYATCSCAACPERMQHAGSMDCTCVCEDPLMQDSGEGCECPDNMYYADGKCLCTESCGSGSPSPIQDGRTCGCSCPHGFSYDETSASCQCLRTAEQCNSQGKRLDSETCTCKSCTLPSSPPPPPGTSSTLVGNQCVCTPPSTYPPSFPANQYYAQDGVKGCRLVSCGTGASSSVYIRNPSGTGCTCIDHGLATDICNDQNRPFLSSNCRCGDVCGAGKSAVGGSCVCDAEPPAEGCGESREWSTGSCKCVCSPPPSDCHDLIRHSSWNNDISSCACECPDGQQPIATPGGFLACGLNICALQPSLCDWNGTHWILLEQ